MTADTTYTPPSTRSDRHRGGRGIGAAIAERLGAEGRPWPAGHRRDRQGDRGPAGGRASPSGRRRDVSDEARSTRVVGEVAAELGPPTVLVNNAGVLRDNLLFKMSARTGTP